LREVERYTRAADQARLARNAMVRIAPGTPGNDRWLSASRESAPPTSRKTSRERSRTMKRTLLATLALLTLTVSAEAQRCPAGQDQFHNCLSMNPGMRSGRLGSLC
jgi:hypothetical protein